MKLCKKHISTFSSHHVGCSKYSRITHHLAKNHLTKYIYHVSFARNFKKYEQVTNVLLTKKNTNELPFGKKLTNHHSFVCKSPMFGVKVYNVYTFQSFQNKFQTSYKIHLDKLNHFCQCTELLSKKITLEFIISLFG